MKHIDSKSAFHGSDCTSVCKLLNTDHRVTPLRESAHVRGVGVDYDCVLLQYCFVIVGKSRSTWLVLLLCRQICYRPDSVCFPAIFPTTTHVTRSILLYRLFHPSGYPMLWAPSPFTITFLLSHPPSKQGWKRCVFLSLHETLLHSLRISIPSFPLLYDLRYSQLQFVCCRPVSLLKTIRDVSISRLLNFRVRLLLHCSELSFDTNVFWATRDRNRSVSCPLCHLSIESAFHFLTFCDRLSDVRDIWCKWLEMSPTSLFEFMMCKAWSDDQVFQTHLLLCLRDLRNRCANSLLQITLNSDYFGTLLNWGGNKEEDDKEQKEKLDCGCSFLFQPSSFFIASSYEKSTAYTGRETEISELQELGSVRVEIDQQF